MRLIDADSLIEECYKDGAYGYIDALQIATAPTIEAEFVKHGHWISGNGEHSCGANSFEKISNGDRIRAMSDEDMAKHLVDIGWDCRLCAEHRRLDNEPFLRGEKCDEKCEEHCLEWLQHPY